MAELRDQTLPVGRHLGSRLARSGRKRAILRRGSDASGAMCLFRRVPASFDEAGQWLPTHATFKRAAGDAPAAPEEASMRDVSNDRLRAGMAAALIGAAITVCAPPVRCGAKHRRRLERDRHHGRRCGRPELPCCRRGDRHHQRRRQRRGERDHQQVHPLRVKTDAPGGASTTAAAVGAAHRALTQLLPSQTQFLDTMLAQSLAKFGVSLERPGVRLWRGGRRPDRRDARRPTARRWRSIRTRLRTPARPVCGCRRHLALRRRCCPVGDRCSHGCSSRPRNSGPTRVPTWRAIAMPGT